MLDDINSPVVAVAGVTVASTTGALVAMGHRAGSAGLPFASISAFVLHRTVTADAVGLVFVGLVLHMLAMFVWSFVFVWVVEHAPASRSAPAGTSVRIVAPHSRSEREIVIPHSRSECRDLVCRVTEGPRC